MSVTMVTGGRRLPTDPQTIHVEQAASNVQYIGRAEPGSLDSDPVWQIYRVSTVGNITTTEYADGGNYDLIWDSRTTYFGPIPPPPPPGPTGSDGEFNSLGLATSVPANTLTDILTYTVAPNNILSPVRIECSGSNIGTYEFYVNNVLQGRLRTYFGASLNATFELSDYPTKGFVPLNEADVLKVKVTHARPYTGDFEARVQGILITTG